MTILVISDVHANLEALRAVFEACTRENVAYDFIFNLGDLVGYGADPNAVVDYMRHLTVEIYSVVGNHDYAALTGDVAGFNPAAAEAALWTRKMLSEDVRRYLTRLPSSNQLTVGRWQICLVHGSPADPLNEYVFPSTPRGVLEGYLEQTRCGVLLMGHTHVPLEIRFPERGGVAVNPGSVGQPRDGVPTASFAVLTEVGESLRVDIRRATYDVVAAAEKILDAGLPPILGARLYQGW